MKEIKNVFILLILRSTFKLLLPGETCKRIYDVSYFFVDVRDALSLQYCTYNLLNEISIIPEFLSVIIES